MQSVCWNEINPIKKPPRSEVAQTKHNKQFRTEIENYKYNELFQNSLHVLNRLHNGSGAYTKFRGRI